MTSTGQDVGTDDDPYYAGDTLELTIDVVAEGGGPKDLTGATLQWGVARKRGDDEVISETTTGVDVSVTDAGAGEVTVTLDAGVTDDLAGSYIHELQVEDAAADKDTVTVGQFIVTRDIAG